MTRLGLFAFVVTLAAGGCSLVRSPLVPTTSVDGGMRDAPIPPDLDAPIPPDLDAPIPPDLDAPIPPGVDAPVPVDAGTDAPAIDAPIRPDAPVTCTPSAESCNGGDDDCDGSVDEDSTCSSCTSPGSCGACVRFEAGGRVYQSCPSMSGLQYWRRVCWTLGAGYELAVLDDATESDAVAAALRADTAIDETHWLGINDFESNGNYVTVTGMPLAWTPTFSDAFAPRSSEGFVGLQADGLLDDFPTGWNNRALCELGRGGRTCTPPAAADDTTCDGRDDDCDGFVDENCTGTATCTARVFWTSVHYLCTDDMTYTEATTACDGMSGSVVSRLDSRFELAFAADFTPADAWVGLTQAPTAAEPDMGWSWGPTAFTSADPDWMAIWDTGQPSSMADEDCAFIKDSAGRLQDQDCTTNRTATLCEHGLP